MIKATLTTILTFVLIAHFSFSQNFKQAPDFQAVRVTDPPSIDGLLDEEVWQNVNSIIDFRQKEPDFDTQPTHQTEVKIIYDDRAIYVGAMMYDTDPDSIFKELGVRDNSELNSDYFSIAFDTYNNKQDAYHFSVSASGVQSDQRVVDPTYDAVWASAVRINEKGWAVELRIPYSAIRFPAIEEQKWGMQIERRIRRNRESIRWSLEPREADNTLNYWGTLSGLQGIDPPLRLSILPYLSAGIQHNGDKNADNNGISYQYNGGMDVKWGLNESFTLDMILLPDFSQVQSDEVEKNLSPFEIVYDENRPFFNEGTDLFQKGDLFYSRRIGHVPLNYYSVYDSLRNGEHLETNPYSSKLLNAVKVSGRTSSGLGIGIFNAITGNTYAICVDTNDNKREILTDPLTNYNIIVLDQSLPNNSSVYLINTNVTRPEGWKQSNVTGGGFKLSEKSNTYQFKFDISLSNNKIAYAETTEEKQKPGVNYNVEFTKIRGNFRFSLYQLAMDHRYDRNELGLNRTNDWLDRGLTIGYNIFKPFGKFRYLYQSINFFREEKLTTHENINSVISYRFNTTLVNYLSLWGTVAYSPLDRYDYYEPRVYGRYWINTGYTQATLNFSSDYRKTLAIDGFIETSSDLENTRWIAYDIEPIIRINDRFKLSPEFLIQFGKDDKGFAAYRNDSIYFGIRNIQTMINSISGEYKFSNKASVSIWLRHYWQKGDYSEFLYLNNEGNLTDAGITDHYYNDLKYRSDYNYNSFNIDLVFGWEFSPGSLMNIVWKNALQHEDKLYQLNYLRNFEKMINSPQINNLSVKFIYYLDYQMLKKRT